MVSHSIGHCDSNCGQWSFSTNPLRAVYAQRGACLVPLILRPTSRRESTSPEPSSYPSTTSAWVAGLAMSPGSWNSPAWTTTHCAGLSSERHASTWLSGSSSTRARGFTVAPSSSSTRVPRRWSSPRAAFPGPVTPPCQVSWTTWVVPSGHSPARPLVSGAKRSARTTRGPSSSGVISSVLTPRRDLPSKVSRGPVTSTLRGVSPNVPKSPVSRTVRCSRGSSAGWRVAQLGTTLSPSERTTKNDSGTTLSTCSCVENTTGIPSSPATLEPHKRLAAKGSWSRP